MAKTHYESNKKGIQKYYEENKEKVKEYAKAYSKAYYDKNKEEINKKQHLRRLNKKLGSGDIEKTKENL